MADGDLLRPIVDGLLGQHHAGASLALRFDDVRLRVESNAHRLINELADYYLEFLGSGADEPDIVVTALDAEPPPFAGREFTIRQRDPGKSGYKEEWTDFPDGRVVRKVRTGMVLIMCGDAHVAVGPIARQQSQVINFVNNRYAEVLLRRGALMAHAAGVAFGRRGVAVAGRSGRGKSTLGLKLMDTPGSAFVSNDRLLLLRQEGRLTMAGLPKHPRINPGTILGNPSLRPILSDEEYERFSALPEEALRTLEHKYDAVVHRCFGPGRFLTSAPLRAFFVLNWSWIDAPLEIERVELAERPDLFELFIKSPALFYLPGAADPPGTYGAEDYLRALEGSRLHELAGGVRFEEARERIAAIVDAHG